MRPAAFLLAALVCVCAYAVPAAADGPVLLDRVAAHVDDRTILRSDVLARARPFMARATGPAEAKTVYRDVLVQMVDEILIEKDAARKRLSVSDDEVKHALESILAQNKVGRAELDAELAKNGIPYDDYVADIRRQILEAKWLRLALPRDAELPNDPQKLVELLATQRKQLLDKLRQASYVDVRE